MLKKTVGLIHGKTVFNRRAQVLSTLIAALLPTQAKVLDVGTGSGQIAHFWHQARDDISVEGIDVFVRSDTHIPVRSFDGETIPYANKSMDVVTFVDVLHHTTNAQTLLAEAQRVARKSIIIKDHLAETSLDHWTLRFMDWVGNAPHGVVLPYNYFSMADWNSMITEAGPAIRSFNTAIPLYVPPLSFVFGRKLHFIADLDPAQVQA
jgi:SAM-dependent methyltransferase